MKGEDHLKRVLYFTNGEIIDCKSNIFCPLTTKIVRKRPRFKLRDITGRPTFILPHQTNCTASFIICYQHPNIAETNGS